MFSTRGRRNNTGHKFVKTPTSQVERSVSRGLLSQLLGLVSGALPTSAPFITAALISERRRQSSRRSRGSRHPDTFSKRAWRGFRSSNCSYPAPVSSWPSPGDPAGQGLVHSSLTFIHTFHKTLEFTGYHLLCFLNKSLLFNGHAASR